MWWIISGFIIFIAYACVQGDKYQKEQVEKYRKDGLAHISTMSDVDFYGGFTDVGATDKCTITLVSNHLRLDLSNGNSYIKKIIDLDNIINMEIKTETQINNQVSLGKMAIFGMFSLAMKPNQKASSINFVVMNIKRDGGVQNLIFKPSDCYVFMSTINLAKNKFMQNKPINYKINN